MQARAILPWGVLHYGEQHTEHGQAAKDALISYHLERSCSNIIHHCTA